MASKALKSAKEEQQELEALHRLDEEFLLKQELFSILWQGDYLKAFDCMERALVLRRHFFGAESPEVLHACKALAEMCNLLSMSFLQQDNYAVTIDLLKKAEILTKHHPSEKATTLNNLACYYRRLGKLHAAMTCLKRALELEKKMQNVRNAADTHLNLCAVLSQLGKHPQALEQAQEALIILQEEFFQSKQPTGDSVESAKKKAKKKGIGLEDNLGESGDSAAIGSSPSASSQQIDRVSVMCITYHNIGVEQEFLKDYANSVMSYKKGVGLAEQYLGVDHAITTTVRNSYLAAKRTISTKSDGRTHRGASAPGGGPLDSPLSTKSPGKASTRLLNSPRSNGNSNSNSLTNSLRLPSPLAKEKQRHNIGDIPSPRSIVADVLSKGATLPPLDPGRSPMRGGVLSPRDPFFSPRFRFNGGDEGEIGGGASGSKSPMSVKKIKKKEVKFETSPPPVVEPEPLSNNNSTALPELDPAIESPPPAAPAMESRVEDTPISVQDDLSSSPQASADNLFLQAESPGPSMQAALDEMPTAEDPLSADPVNLAEDSQTPAFQIEESPASLLPPVTESPIADSSGGDDISCVADFGENSNDSADASGPPEADGVPLDHPLGPDSTLEDSSPLTEYDESSVTASLQKYTVNEPDANEGEPISSSAVPASDEIAHFDLPAAVSISMSGPAEADDHEPDAQIGSLDSQSADMEVNQIDSELLPASARMVEISKNEGLEELHLEATASFFPDSNPDDLSVAIAARESLGLNNAQELRESDEHDKDEILDLLDESADDGVHSMERQDGHSMSTSELPVDPTNSNEAIDTNEELSIPEKSYVESAEAEQIAEVVENASDSLVIDEPNIGDAIPQDGDASVIAPAHEDGDGEQVGTEHNILADTRDGESLDSDRHDASDFNAFAHTSDEMDASEAHEVHAESAVDELVDPEYYSHHQQQEAEVQNAEYPPSEEYSDANWNAEIGSVHSSETLAESTTDDDALHEKLSSEDNFALETEYNNEHQPEEEQSTNYHHDDDSDYQLPQSEYADASGQEAYEHVGEFPYHHGEMDTTFAPPEFDYLQVADTKHDETNMDMANTERNPSPDPVYDDQFEHEAAEESDHLQGYPHDPNEPFFAEYSSSAENTPVEEHVTPVTSEGDATMGFDGFPSFGEHDAAFESGELFMDPRHQNELNDQAPTVALPAHVQESEGGHPKEAMVKPSVR